MKKYFLMLLVGILGTTLAFSTKARASGSFVDFYPDFDPKGGEERIICEYGNNEEIIDVRFSVLLNNGQFFENVKPRIDWTANNPNDDSITVSEGEFITTYSFNAGMLPAGPKPFGAPQQNGIAKIICTITTIFEDELSACWPPEDFPTLN